jgi:tetratricopeptide (TPR) repeat protein
MRVLVASLVVCGIVSLAPTVRAAPKVELNDLQKAQAHFKLGKVHFDLGEYDKAIEEFDLAYRLQPLPLLLYNSGLAARRADRPALALQRFNAFLREAPKAEERPEVESYLPELERRAAAAPPTPVAPTPTAGSATPATPLAHAAVVAPVATPHAPVYKRWWLWTAVGGAVALGVGLGVGLSLGLSSGSSFKPTLPDVSFGRAGLSVAF